MFKDIYSKYKTKVDAALEDYINELQDEYRELSNEDCIEITNTYADEIMSINGSLIVILKTQQKRLPASPWLCK